MTDKPALWTVYGELATNLMLCSWTGAGMLWGAFLDLSVKYVAFVASNMNSGQDSIEEKFSYPVKRGRVPPLLSRCATPSLSLMLSK